MHHNLTKTHLAVTKINDLENGLNDLENRHRFLVRFLTPPHDRFSVRFREMPQNQLLAPTTPRVLYPQTPPPPTQLTPPEPPTITPVTTRLPPHVSWPLCVCGHPSFHHPKDGVTPACDTPSCRCDGYWPSGLFTR